MSKDKLPPRQENFVNERIRDKKATNTEIARRVGYSPKTADKKAYQLMHDERIASRIQGLVDTGLDALERIATTGNNEIAVAAAGKTLVETGLGKPKDNKQSNFGDVTINIAKIDPETLRTLTAN